MNEKIMNKKYLTYIIILALAGLILSVILAKIDIDAVHNPIANSFCNINEAFNCVKVAQSEFASQFGIPNFIFGIILYLAILVFTAISRFSTKKILPNIMTYVFWLSLYSVMFSAYLFYVSMTVIKSFCIFCTGVYLVNLLMFLVSFMSEGFSIKKLFSSLIEDLKVFFRSGLRAGIFFACVIFGVIGLAYFSAHPVLGDSSTSHSSDTSLKIDYSKTSFDRLVTGPSGNPGITMLLFTDFECPFCGRASVEIHKLLKQNPDIRLIFKDYPLDQSCNYVITRPFHEYACQASICARCAADQGKFWEYHDLIYANQGSIKSDSFDTFAEELGLDLNAFKECVKSKKPMDKILTDIDEAMALKVGGTPTIFVEGKKIEGFRTAEELQKVVDEVRQEQAKEKAEQEKERQEYEKRQKEAAQNQNKGQ